jgi:MoxR-like ATPase
MNKIKKEKKMTDRKDKKGLVRKIAGVDEALRSHTSEYFNRRTFFDVRDPNTRRVWPYDVNDMILLGALTNSDLLLSGGTGKGKTHLARRAMNGLYGGEGFTNLTVTPGLNESDFIDVDVNAVKSGGKTLKQAIERTPLLIKPGAIVNEINRTPEILQNLFISYLERIFSLKGLEFPVGVGINPDGEGVQDPHYQFRVITINEGANYSGTSGIDRAVRDRVVIEIPMDYFNPRKDDRRRMIRSRKDTGLSVEKTNGGKLEDILEVTRSFGGIPVSASAEEFLVYLGGLSNCVKSPTGSKQGINFKQRDMCDGCHHAKDDVLGKGNVCGSVYAPSDRSLINLEVIGRMVAGLRAYKVIDALSRGQLEVDNAEDFARQYIDNLQVTLDDITSVAPFILSSKMIIDPAWIEQHYSGSKFLATQDVIRNALERFKNFTTSDAYEALVNSDGKMTQEAKQRLLDYAKTRDPWAYHIQDLDNPYSQYTGKRQIKLDKLLV